MGKASQKKTKDTDNLEASEYNLLERKIIDSVKHSINDETILFTPLNDSIYMLVVPPTFQYSSEETNQVASEIQQGILPNKHNDEPYLILSWKHIVNENHLTTPSKIWKFLQKGNKTADTKLIFFTNIEQTRKLVAKSATDLGFEVESHYGSKSVSISNGEFEERIDILSVLSRSLWQAQDIPVCVNSLMRTMVSTFRCFDSILHELKKRYPDASFWRESGKLHVMLGHVYGSIDYRNIAKSLRFNKTTTKNWVGETTLSDLLRMDEYPVLSIRSKVFAKARPEALCQEENGFVVAIETIFDQRLRPVKFEENTSSKQRIKHYINEAIRHVSKRQFNAHVFIGEDERFGCALIGDQIASIATYPGLIYGAIEALGRIPGQVRVRSTNEDTIVIVDIHAPESLIEDLELKSQSILKTLYPDGSDMIELDSKIKLPQFACGEFNFSHIPLPFFELFDTAEDKNIALPPGRSDYLKGLAFELIQEWALAIHSFKRAYSFDSADGEISYALGRAMSELEQHQESLTFLERAFDKLPEDPDVANSLGVAYLECHQKENAIRVLKHAVDMQPDDVQFLFNLGRCYFASQKLKDAEKVLTKAIRYAPNFPEAHATLAQVRWLLGDLSSAKKHARKAFATSPNNRYVKDLYWALTMDEEDGA